MLTQLSRLSVEADGRYAKSEELAPVKDYIQTLEQRLRIYEIVRANAEEIIEKTSVKMRAMNPKIFYTSDGDRIEVWRQDIVMLVRYACASLLFNDPDHLREGLLLWHHTIATSYKFDTTCRTTFDVMPEVVKEYLSEEDAKLFIPILKLNQVVLA